MIDGHDHRPCAARARAYRQAGAGQPGDCAHGQDTQERLRAHGLGFREGGGARGCAAYQARPLMLGCRGQPSWQSLALANAATTPHHPRQRCLGCKLFPAQTATYRSHRPRQNSSAGGREGGWGPHRRIGQGQGRCLEKCGDTAHPPAGGAHSLGIFAPAARSRPPATTNRDQGSVPLSSLSAALPQGFEGPTAPNVLFQCGSSPCV